MFNKLISKCSPEGQKERNPPVPYSESKCQEALRKFLLVFVLPSFVKPYQSSKARSSCLGARQIFVRREIGQILLIYKPRFEGIRKSTKFELAFEM